MLTGDNGIIKRAENAAETSKIEEMREKLEMAKIAVFVDGQGEYDGEKYWDIIESEGIIVDKATDILDNGNGTYKVTTTPGYMFLITLYPNKEKTEEIIIGEYLGKNEKLNIGIKIINKTTNSIEIEIVRAEGIKSYKYSIKKDGEEYGDIIESNEGRHIFKDLIPGSTYTIKVEGIKEGKVKTAEKTINIGEWPEIKNGGIIWGDNGQATLKIYTDEEGYQLEWQKNKTEEENWTRENEGVKEKTILGLVNGDKIYARLFNGSISGAYIEITIVDNKAPEINKFEAVEIKGTRISVNVEAIDNESGIDEYEYYIGTEVKNKNKVSKYTFTDLTPVTKYELKVVVKDKAGNSSEKIIEITTTKATVGETLKQGDYVEYIDKGGITRKCMVLWDTASGYGTQIITLDSVGDMELGSGALGSPGPYDLNKKAMEYNNEQYSEKARIVGSSPSDYTPIINSNVSEKDVIDVGKLKELNILDIGKDYWFAAEVTSNIKKNTCYHISGSNGISSYTRAQYDYWGSFQKAYSKTCGVRPVFSLKPELLIAGGNGKEGNPYRLGSM